MTSLVRIFLCLIFYNPSTEKPTYCLRAACERESGSQSSSLPVFLGIMTEAETSLEIGVGGAPLVLHTFKNM